MESSYTQGSDQGRYSVLGMIMLSFINSLKFYISILSRLYRTGSRNVHPYLATVSFLVILTTLVVVLTKNSIKTSDSAELGNTREYVGVNTFNIPDSILFGLTLLVSLVLLGVWMDNNRVYSSYLLGFIPIIFVLGHVVLSYKIRNIEDYEGFVVNSCEKETAQSIRASLQQHNYTDTLAGPLVYVVARQRLNSLPQDADSSKVISIVYTAVFILQISKVIGRDSPSDLQDLANICKVIEEKDELNLSGRYPSISRVSRSNPDFDKAFANSLIRSYTSSPREIESLNAMLNEKLKQTILIQNAVSGNIEGFFIAIGFLLLMLAVPSVQLKSTGKRAIEYFRRRISV